MVSRREVLKGLSKTAAAAALSSTARSYSQIAGANNRLNFAVIGLNGRAYAHLSSLKANEKSARISHVCDVDSTILAKFTGEATKQFGTAPKQDRDFRKMLESKDVDVITIATPDHWHAPIAVAGLQAGKHVYVEKPCSHNPTEGEILVAAQRRYGKLVQMGNQQRSSPHTIEIVGKIHDGLIGRAYFRQGVVQQHAQDDGHGQGGSCSSHARLGAVAGTCTPKGTMFTLTTGTGCKPMGRERRSTTELTRWMSAGGLSELIILTGSRLPAVDTSSRMTGSSTTRW